ncbi:hypothetical protein KSS87_022317 [Heliosperma pusillum]|nr:hypothetical protein KSS87_022317 [Heliosperma pusillum]
MVSLLIQNGLIPTSLTLTTINPIKNTKPIICFQSKTPKFLPSFKFINKILKPNSKNCQNVIDLPSKVVPFNENNHNNINKIRGDVLVVEVQGDSKKYDAGKVYSKQNMMLLCGFGYWIQGFRCFPWLALNFHMANTLNFDPSTLQLVQHFGNLPMVAKPFYGILSDAIYIGGAHRIPYICIGVLLQVLSWGPLAVVPFVGKVLPTIMACVLLSNLGAAITEVAQDALVAEYGQKHKVVGLQSYTFMAIAIAGIVGNLVGGMLLLKTPPQTALVIFTSLLLLQLVINLSTKEEWLGLSKPLSHLEEQETIVNSVKRQFSNLLVALRTERISQPMMWIVASISIVPMLTGSIFCYQTQFLHLDPSIIGMSKVVGQMLLLSLTVLYDRFWKTIPLRKLVARVQILYAATLLLDFVLVKQINIQHGISNEVFALCFSGLAETIATFKTVPFFVLIGSLCPPGCEASVIAFLASAMTLSSIVSAFFGVGLANVLGINSGSYSSLPIGIAVQCLAALVPLIWINSLPLELPAFEKEGKKGRSKRNRRYRRVGRVTLNSIFSYRRERKSEPQI